MPPFCKAKAVRSWPTRRGTDQGDLRSPARTVNGQPNPVPKPYRRHPSRHTPLQVYARSPHFAQSREKNGLRRSLRRKPSGFRPSGSDRKWGNAEVAIVF